jgi:hypothetical protein
MEDANFSTVIKKRVFELQTALINLEPDGGRFALKKWAVLLLERKIQRSVPCYLPATVRAADDKFL